MRDVPVRQDSHLTRRDVCKGFVQINGALLGSTLPIEARAQVDLRQKVGILPNPPSQGDFYHAQLRRSENGVLDTALRIDYARCRVGDKEAWLRCYDGEPVGPTLRLRRGETLKLRVENHLPVEDGHPSSPGHGGAHRAPTQRFSDANGRSLSLADFAGRVVLLNFWASSCPPCRDELSRLDDLQRQIEEDAHRRAEERTESGPEPRDFVVLAVSWDADVSAAQRLFEEAGVKNLHIYFDPNRALGRALFGGWLGINAFRARCSSTGTASCAA